MLPCSGIRAITRRVAGSMRSSVWESVSVSHAEPKAGTTMSSPPAGARRATTFGAAGAGSSAPSRVRP